MFRMIFTRVSHIILCILIKILIAYQSSLENGIETVPADFTYRKTEESSSSEETFPTTSASDIIANKTRATTLKVTINVNNAEEWLNKNETPSWYEDAIKDIAYYLRAHKFNDYDRRYNRNGIGVERLNFKYFPKPPLRSLHWEVHRYCENSFLHCVDYLRKKLLHVALKRQDDTTIVAEEYNWKVSSSQFQQIEAECQKMRKIDDEIAEPFEGPLERYQWRVTASYFMCWYTMNEVPDLMHLNDKCDNFAYCFDNSTGLHNEDLRANDKQAFACATYSFCPDPCCPYKHLRKWESCWNNEENPCYQENTEEHQRQCKVNRPENKEFSNLIMNKWNTTCHCTKNGFIWSSFYGICVDIDECIDEKQNNCRKNEGEICVNTVGSFRCICKWGYLYNKNSKKCEQSDALSKMTLKITHPSSKNKENKWKNFMITAIRIIGGKPSLNKSISVVSSQYFLLVLMFFYFVL